MLKNLLIEEWRDVKKWLCKTKKKMAKRYFCWRLFSVNKEQERVAQDFADLVRGAKDYDEKLACKRKRIIANLIDVGSVNKQ